MYFEWIDIPECKNCKTLMKGTHKHRNIIYGQNGTNKPVVEVKIEYFECKTCPYKFELIRSNDIL